MTSMLSHHKSRSINCSLDAASGALVSTLANISGMGVFESACTERTWTRVVRFVVRPSSLRVMAMARYRLIADQSCTRTAFGPVP